jgi:hypothetical protein
LNVALEQKLQIFNALSYGDKVRVARCLARGKAPNDPRLAAAAVELAESYRHQSRAQAAFMRWAPVVTAVILSALTLPAAIAGDLPMAIALFLVALCGIAYIVFDPAARPKNVARSLDASRQVAAVT